jgi:hypothetical protein
VVVVSSPLVMAVAGAIAAVYWAQHDVEVANYKANRSLVEEAYASSVAVRDVCKRLRVSVFCGTANAAEEDIRDVTRFATLEVVNPAHTRVVYAVTNALDVFFAHSTFVSETTRNVQLNADPSVVATDKITWRPLLYGTHAVVDRAQLSTHDAVFDALRSNVKNMVLGVRKEFNSAIDEVTDVLTRNYAKTSTAWIVGPVKDAVLEAMTTGLRSELRTVVAFDALNADAKVADVASRTVTRRATIDATADSVSQELDVDMMHHVMSEVSNTVTNIADDVYLELRAVSSSYAMRQHAIVATDACIDQRLYHDFAVYSNEVGELAHATSVATAGGLEDWLEGCCQISPGTEVRETEAAIRNALRLPVRNATREAVSPAVAGDLSEFTKEVVDVAIFDTMAVINSRLAALLWGAAKEAKNAGDDVTDEGSTVEMSELLHTTADTVYTATCVPSRNAMRLAVDYYLANAVYAACSWEQLHEIFSALEDTLDAAIAKQPAYDPLLLEDAARETSNRIKHPVSDATTESTDASTNSILLNLTVYEAEAVSALSGEAVDMSLRSATVDATVYATRVATSAAVGFDIDHSLRWFTAYDPAVMGIQAEDAVASSLRVALNREELNSAAQRTESMRMAVDRATRSAIEEALYFQMRTLPSRTPTGVHVVSESIVVDRSVRTTLAAVQDVAARKLNDALNRGMQLNTDMFNMFNKQLAMEAQLGPMMDVNTLRDTWGAVASGLSIGELVGSAEVTAEDLTVDGVYRIVRDTSLAVGVRPEDVFRVLPRFGEVYSGGNMWAAFDAYLTAARDILGLRLPEHAAYEAWEDSAKLGGFRYMHKKFCLVCDFPDVIKKDAQHRPHCTDGPSHRWSDGWSLWHIDGNRVDEQIVMRPHTQTIAQIERESVQDVKAIRIERYGWDRYLRDTNSECLDEFDNELEGTMEALFVTPDGDKRLVATCATGRLFSMGVPEHIKTCDEARLWRQNDRRFNVLART